MLSDDTTEMWSWASRLSPPFIYMFAHQQTCFIFPVSTIPSFYKHLSYLRIIRADQMHSAMRERLLPHDCHVGRLATCFAHVSQPWIHCNTPKDTHRHTEKKACALLAHILGLPAHASLNSAFNLAHRWRVLTALHPALCTHTHTHKHPHSRHQELVLENCNTNWEKKKNRSEAVSGKDDSGENSFSYNWSKRQKKTNPLVTICVWVHFLCMHMHACMHWHNNTVAFHGVWRTFGKRIVSPRLSHYWNTESDRRGTLTDILVKGLIDTHS